MRPIDADVLKEEVDMAWCPDMAVTEIWNVIDDAPTVSGWISIDDELPEPVSARNMKDIMPVMLYSPKGGYYVGWYYGPDWNGKKLFVNRTSRDSWQYITTKVTHWMPLQPEPEVSE